MRISSHFKLKWNSKNKQTIKQDRKELSSLLIQKHLILFLAPSQHGVHCVAQSSPFGSVLDVLWGEIHWAHVFDDGVHPLLLQSSSRWAASSVESEDCSWHRIFCTCPYHCRRASLIFFSIGVTPSRFRTPPFVTWSRRVKPTIHLSIFISVALRICSCFLVAGQKESLTIVRND